MQGPAHACVNLLSRNAPIWTKGAVLYWDIRGGAKASVRGASAYSTVRVQLGSGEYWTFDRGKGQYVQITAASGSFPLDGHFAEARANYFNDTTNVMRGPFSVEAGAVGSNPVLDATYIVDISTIPMANGFRVTNMTGSLRRFYRLESTSGTYRRYFSLLAKRTDGGVIDGTVLSLYTASSADPLGSNLMEAATRYKKIRSDGWYQLWAVHPIDGASVYFGGLLTSGFPVDIEAPMTEGVGSSLGAPGQFTESPAGAPTPPLSYIEMARTSGIAEPYPACGWFGAAFTNRWAHDEPHDQPGPRWKTAYIANWQVDGSNKVSIYMSQTSQVWVGWMRKAGTSELFLTGPATWAENEAMGIVMTWGSRKGSQYGVLAVNGKQYDVETLFSLPTGTPNFIEVGDIGGLGYAQSANCHVEAMAVGRQALTRLDARHLSLWFKDQAVGVIR